VGFLRPSRGSPLGEETLPTACAVSCSGGLHSFAASRLVHKNSNRRWPPKIPTSRAKNAREIGHPSMN